MSLLIIYFPRTVKVLEGELVTPEYKLINPTSTVPALVDGNTKIFDSNAIAIYMVEKYGKDDSLYPKDLELRTKVNERLFYIASYFFPRGYQIFFPVFRGEATGPSESAISELLRGYATFESFLVGNDYLTGSTLTLCDYSLWCLMESGSRIQPIDPEKFPNFFRWLNKMRELPFYEKNKEGAEKHVELYQQCRARNIEMLKKTKS